MSIALASVAGATLALMDIREVRRERLLQLLREQKGRGKQRILGVLIGKAPAQVSQWVNRKRTITEDTAREIETKARRPRGWMDLDPTADNVTGHYAPLAAPAHEHTPAAGRAFATPPPLPARNFDDRRAVSETDWAVLQAVKLVLPEPELERIKSEAERIRRMAAEQIEAANDGRASPAKE